MSKVHFEDISYIKELLATIAHSQLFVLVDENSKENCYPLIKGDLKTHQLIEIASGEKNKTLGSCQFIWNALTLASADRKALLINLGGGVITDMGGFCAATYKRGIRFINIPTTLLAQVDASVGGKTGIDFNGFKNHIGVFAEAEAVIVDPVFHSTLPDRQLKSGFAEMLKHGLIADKNHWEKCLKTGYQNVSSQLIKDSVAIKEKVVLADPKEKGERKILNFGHTIGHAIESHLLATANEILHGEAIGIGMLVEAYISKETELLKESDFQIIYSEVGKIYKKPTISIEEYDQITQLCLQDKKNENGIVNMSLLKQLGEACYDVAIDEKTIKRSLNEVLKLHF